MIIQLYLENITSFMFYRSIINESKCLNSIKKTKCTTLKAMYISLRLPQINPSSNLYIPQVNHYILLSLSLSLSLHLNWSPSILPFTPLSIFFIQTYATFFFFFKSKRMQSFARTSRALSF